MRAVWEDVYLAAQKSSLTGAAKTFSISDIGPAFGACALPVVGHPNFILGQQMINVNRVSGLVMDRYEDSEEDFRICATTLDFELDIKTFSLFCYLFFQKGSIQPDADSKRYFPYDFTSCEVFATLGRRMSLSDTNSHILDGAVCSELSISGRVGEAIKFSAVMIGRSLITDFDWDAQSSTAVFPEDQVLLFKDTTYTSTLFSSGTGVSSFAIRLSNGVTPYFYNSQLANEFKLKKLTGTLEVTVQQNRVSTLAKGNAKTVGQFLVDLGGGRACSISMPGEIKDVVEVEEEGESMQRVSMDIKSRGSDSPFIYLVDLVNRGIPATRG